MVDWSTSSKKWLFEGWKTIPQGLIRSVMISCSRDLRCVLSWKSGCFGRDNNRTEKAKRCQGLLKTDNITFHCNSLPDCCIMARAVRKRPYGVSLPDIARNQGKSHSFVYISGREGNQDL